MAATDIFRLNMMFGYGPNGPGTNPNGGVWNDVADWQVFLQTIGGQGYLLGMSYPTDNFDNNTEIATKNFQSAQGLPMTGIVNIATFDAAVVAGMTKYQTITV
jgi:peptidoglycan hydrolase-like protein with peptidoglycan-binding domain